MLSVQSFGWAVMAVLLSPGNGAAQKENTVLLSPILVIFYRGFLQLSKSLLDPFGNEDSTDENFNVFTLICETNKGSLRWFQSVEELPFTPVAGTGRSIFG